MAVVRFNNDILASSNLKDIKNYCERHKITYLTTMDFLCEVLRTNLFDLEGCNSFISAIRAVKGKLPVKEMKEYDCQKKI